MKNFVIRILLKTLTLFTDLIVNRLNSLWVKRATELAIKRLMLFGEALVDADPNDKDQIEKIARETLMSPEFQQFEKQITLDIASKIDDARIANLLIQSDALRLNLFNVLGDDDPNNKEQIKDLFASFVKTEEFDNIVIGLADLLADKYAKNPATKEFVMSLVTSLVNSDDQD